MKDIFKEEMPGQIYVKDGNVPEPRSAPPFIKFDFFTHFKCVANVLLNFLQYRSAAYQDAVFVMEMEVIRPAPPFARSK